MRPTGDRPSLLASLATVLALLGGCEIAEPVEPRLPAVTGLALDDPQVGNQLQLSWVNPVAPQVRAVRILRFADTCIDDAASAVAERHAELEITEPGEPQTWLDAPTNGVPDLPDNRTTCYAVFAKAGAEYSFAVTITGISTDQVAPPPISDLTATPGTWSGAPVITLDWRNPEDDDFTTVRVLRREDTPPEGPEDAAAVVVHQGLGDSLQDFESQDGVTYHYRAWAGDEVPNYSTPVDVGPVQRLIDDDNDGQTELEGDCDDTDAQRYRGAPSIDCSATDWDCDGEGFEIAYCEARPPPDLAPGCLLAPGTPTCDEGGCHWPLASCDDRIPATSDETCVSSGACVDGCQINHHGHFQCAPTAHRGEPFVVIPAGAFWMGCNDEVDDCSLDWKSWEVPYHEVYLDAYGIDLTPVTQARYESCVEAGACTADAHSCVEPGQAPDHPMPCLGMDQQAIFCLWAGGRMCTEAEWEKGARGTDGRKYPWGSEWASCELAAMSLTGGQAQDDWACGAGGLLPVGSYPDGASPYGLLDMAGLVWEHTWDWMAQDYYANSPYENPKGPDTGSHKAARGGSITSYRENVRSTTRFPVIPQESSGYLDTGWRCCYDLAVAEP